MGFLVRLCLVSVFLFGTAPAFAKLLEPVFLGLPTAGTKFLKVDNLQRGSRVEVFQYGEGGGPLETNRIGNIEASATVMTVPLTDDLEPGMWVMIRVSVAGETPQTNRRRVGPALTDLPTPRLELEPDTVIAMGSECVRVAGALRMSELQIIKMPEGGGQPQVIGRGRANENGEATISLTRPALATDDLVLRSATTIDDAESDPGTYVVDKRPIPPRPQDHTQVLQIGRVQECERFITIGNHERGAIFDVLHGLSFLPEPEDDPFDRKRTPVIRRCAAEPGTFSALPRGRVFGVEADVRAFQYYLEPMTPPGSDAVATVQSLGKLPTPRIGEVFIGQSDIEIGGLNPSAWLIVEHVDVSEGQTYPYERNADSATIGLDPPAENGDKIRAMQVMWAPNDVSETGDPTPQTHRRCGEPSDWAEVEVSNDVKDLAPLAAVPEVYDCAGSIEIAGYSPSARVIGFIRNATTRYAFTGFRKPDVTQALGGAQVATIQPNWLVPGWQVNAWQTNGSLPDDLDQVRLPTTGWVTVLPEPQDFGAPKVSDPTLKGATLKGKITISYCGARPTVDALKGATLSVTVDGQPRTAMLARTAPAVIDLKAMGIGPGAVLSLQQRLCKAPSDPSSPAVVAGKLRIAGRALSDGVVIDPGEDEKYFQLEIESPCKAPVPMKLEIKSNRPKIARPLHGNTIDFPADADKVTVWFVSEMRGYAELEIVNADAYNYVQVGPDGWDYDPTAHKTVVGVSAWMKREHAAKTKKLGRGLGFDFPADTEYPVYVQRVGHPYHDLRLVFTNRFHDRPTDSCEADSWAEAQGDPFATAPHYSDFDEEDLPDQPIYVDFENYISSRLTAEKEILRSPLRICPHGGGLRQPPYDVKVWYRELIKPNRKL